MTSSFNPSTVTTPTPTGTAGDLSEKTSTLEPLVASVDSGPVQAYAKLEGDDFCYYIRTLQVTLGRRVSNPDNVDIPLGNTKSVSRQHANLFYNFTNRRFEMIVHGKNGAFVNEQFIEKGVTVPLDNKTKIQIGEMSFVFLLPRTTDGDLTTTTASTRDNSFGYISTPHQLEKKNTKDVVITTANTTTTGTSTTTAAAAVTGTTDYDVESSGGDSGSESSEAYHHNKDVKPPYSYASLIAQAINSSNEKKMTLNGIYNYITTHYPYYQMTQNGWQNSIRHNLSLNKAFIKVPRGDDEPGKGAFWTIDSTAETQFTNGVYKRNKRAAPHSNTKSSDSDHPHQKKRLKGGESDGEEDSIMDKADDNQQHQMNDENNNDNDNDNDNSNEGEREEKQQQQQQYKEEDKEQEDIKKSNITLKGDNNDDVSGKDVDMKSTEMSSTTTTGEMGNINADTVTAATAAAAVDASNNSSQQQVESLKVVSDEVASSSATSSSATATADNSQSIQVQLQLQLQNTIRQHLLDPVRYPLPSSIAQLLPQAIAQLPPQLANQLSSTLQSALKTKEEDGKLNEEKQ